MKLLQIEQFLNFQCIANKCPYTCCRDWDIIVDSDKVELYRKWGYESKFFKIGDSYHMKLDKNRRCAFLDEQDLCRLVTDHGEGALCYTCNVFPRLYKRRGDILEFSLSNGCPEVIRIIRGIKGQLTFILDEMNVEIPIKSSFSDAYYLCRDMVIDILQIPEMPLWIRIYIAYKFSQKADMKNEQQLREVLEQYNSVDYVLQIYQQLIKFSCDTATKLQNCLDLMMNLLSGSKEWYGYKEYIEPVIDKITQTPIEELISAWEEYKPHRNDLENMYENVLVNMIFQNSISNNNDSFFHKELVVLCMEYSSIVMANFFNWYYAGKHVDEEAENVIICYFAKELEHRTTNNIDHLLRLINKDKLPGNGQIVLWIC